MTQLPFSVTAGSSRPGRVSPEAMRRSDVLESSISGAAEKWQTASGVYLLAVLALVGSSGPRAHPKLDALTLCLALAGAFAGARATIGWPKLVFVDEDPTQRSIERGLRALRMLRLSLVLLGASVAVTVISIAWTEAPPPSNRVIDSGGRSYCGNRWSIEGGLMRLEAGKSAVVTIRVSEVISLTAVDRC